MDINLNYLSRGQKGRHDTQSWGTKQLQPHNDDRHGNECQRLQHVIEMLREKEGGYLVRIFYWQ